MRLSEIEFGWKEIGIATVSAVGGYVLINYGKSRLNEYIEKRNEELGKRISLAVREGLKENYQEQTFFQMLYDLKKSVDVINQRISEIEKSVYK